MQRGLLIVICSICFAPFASASWTWSISGNLLRLDYAADTTPRSASGVWQVGTASGSWNYSSGFIGTIRSWSSSSLTGTYYYQSNGGPQSIAVSWNGSAASIIKSYPSGTSVADMKADLENPPPTPPPTPVPSPSPTPEPWPEFETSWYYEFGPEYAGMRMDIVDMNTGNVLDSLVVGEFGAIMVGSVVITGPDAQQPSLELVGYRIDEGGEWVEGGSVIVLNNDGDFESKSVSSWQVQGDNAPVGTSYTGSDEVTYVSQGNGVWSASAPGPPGTVQQTINISENYTYGQWYLLNQNGGIIDTGPVPEGGGTVVTETARMPGEVGSFYVAPFIPGEEGGTFGPLESLGSGISTGQTGTLPTPSAPNYEVVVTNQVTELVVTNLSTELTITNNIEINIPEDEPGTPYNVPDADEPDFEVGEAALLQSLTEMQAKFMEGATNIQGSIDNIGLTFNELRNLVLTPPGQTCTFSMGSYEIELNFPAIREGSKLLFLLIGVAAFIGIIRDLFNG